MFQDLTKALVNINTIARQTETNINDLINNSINNSTNCVSSSSSHREVGYFGSYHYTNNNNLQKVVEYANKIDKYFSSMPVHVDITLCNKGKAWLIETKRQYPLSKYEKPWVWPLANDIIVNDLSNDILYGAFKYENNYFFIDRYIGKVYVDICRLMSINNKNKDITKQRYFCMAYIDRTFSWNVRDALLEGLKFYLNNMNNVKNIITQNTNTKYSLWEIYKVGFTAYDSTYKPINIDNSSKTMPIYYMGSDFDAVLFEVMPVA